MALTAGTRLGPYEIAEPIGKGGMPGEVYRARDTKLERDVAIKVLPQEFAQDEERLARLEREAKLLAYVPYRADALGAVRTLVWVDREGAFHPVSEIQAGYEDPRISPDGRRLAYAIDASGEGAVSPRR